MQNTQVGSYSLFDSLYPDYKITRPVRLIELFGGIGSQAKALERLSVPFESWKLVEIDKFAVASYNAIHGTAFTTSDITELTGEDMSVVDPEVYDYIMTWSFPCFRAGTLVHTGRGLVPIEKVVEGDLVLTHMEEWRKVLKSGRTGIQQLYRVSAVFGTVDCTKNHMFYVIRDLGNGKYSDPKFVPCEEIAGAPGEFYCMTHDYSKSGEPGYVVTDFNKSVRIWARIESVESLKIMEPVYDITVEKDQSFVANGFTVHNCTSLSVAGLRQGMSENSGTASSLIWEVRRLLAEMNQLKVDKAVDSEGRAYGLPKILLMENVPQVIDAKNVGDLNRMRDFLESLGYSNHLAIMKGSDYGVPQARQRAFMVSILGDEENPFYSYQFPTPCGCKWSLNDCLFDDFPDKLVVRTSVSHTVCEQNAWFNRRADVKVPEIKLCGRLNSHQAGAVYDPVGVSPTLTAGGASSVNCLIRRECDKSDSIDFSVTNQPDPIDYGSVSTEEAVEFFLTEEVPEVDPYQKEEGFSWEPVVRDKTEYLVRTFQPKESFLIMDFDQDDCRRAEQVTSNFQLHKQCGNSIVVNCIVALLGQFYEGKKQFYRQVAKVDPKERKSIGKKQNSLDS